MSNDHERLTRKLRRAQNQQTRAQRLNMLLLRARENNVVLRRRIRQLRRALQDRQISLDLALASLRRCPISA